MRLLTAPMSHPPTKHSSTSQPTLLSYPPNIQHCHSIHKASITSLSVILLTMLHSLLKGAHPHLPPASFCCKLSSFHHFCCICSSLVANRTAAMFDINSGYVVQSGGTGGPVVNQQQGAADSKRGEALGESGSRPLLRMHQTHPLPTPRCPPTWLPSARLQALPSSFHPDAER